MRLRLDVVSDKHLYVNPLILLTWIDGSIYDRATRTIESSCEKRKQQK